MKKNLFAAIVIMLIMVKCSSVNTVMLPFYKTKIAYLEGSASFYPNENLKKCKLNKMITLAGNQCMNWIHFFESGQIKQYETAVDIETPRYTIPAKSVIIYNEENKSRINYIVFSKNVIIEGIEFQGDGKITTEFFNDGKVKAGFLAKDQVIQKFPCKALASQPVYFYPDGKVQMLALSKDLEYSQLKFKSGESIILNQKGELTKPKK